MATDITLCHRQSKQN